MNFFDGIFGGSGGAGRDLLRAAQTQDNRRQITREAGGREGDAYCMHSITAAARAAGYTALYQELRGTHGRVSSFMELAQRHGAYIASPGQIPPAGTAAIMDLRSQPGVDHVGISYGDGRYREANPGFRDVHRGGNGIVGYVDLDRLNQSITRQRRSDIEATPLDGVRPQTPIHLTEGTQVTQPNVPDARVAQQSADASRVQG